MSDPKLAEGGRILPHHRITSIADLLPDVHGWDGKVVQIMMERVD